MTLTQLKKYSAVGVIVSTAILLTGLGILFDAFTQNGSAVRLIVGAVPLAILVIAVLKGFQWMLDTWIDSPGVKNVKPAAKQSKFWLGSVVSRNS